MENRALKLETIRNILMNSDDFDVRLAAMKACVGRKNVPLELILYGLRDSSPCVFETAAEACIGQNIPLETILDWFHDKSTRMHLAAMKACKGRQDIPFELIQAGLGDLDSSVRTAALNACEGRQDVPIELIMTGLKNLDRSVYMAAINLCREQNLPLWLIREWLEDPYWHFRLAAMSACQGRNDIPPEMLQAGLTDSDLDVKIAAINACHGRQDVPLEMILENTSHYIDDVRLAVANACLGRNDVPLKSIQRWARSPLWQNRLMAINACEKKQDIPPELILARLSDDSPSVRAMAWKICRERGIEVPISRSFEPKGDVYKKCLGDVIVVATIPPDAYVRGQPHRKCRASKAVIKKIIGDFYGEKVGVSLYDRFTLYRKNDTVEVENFDLSGAECSTGFHFYNSKAKAERQ